MNLEGFHVVDSKHKDNPESYRVPGAVVSASAIERAQPLPTGDRRSWKYADSLPRSVAHDGSLYTYFTVEDIAHNMNKSANTVRELASKHRWRYRKDARYNTKAYYVYDLLVTVWSYMQDWPGNLDSDLLIEAEDWKREANS